MLALSLSHAILALVTPIEHLGCAGRRAVIQHGLVAATCAVLGPMRVAALDDDFDDEAMDEVPDAPTLRTGGTKKQSYSKEDVKAAFADLIACRASIKDIESFLGKSDLASVAPLLAKPPFSSAQDTLLTLVQGPGLGNQEKIQIGTIKRYGIGADVIIMLGGLNNAVKGGNVGEARSYATKAANALDEVIVVCNSGGLK